MGKEVRVKWVDSRFFDGWHLLEDASKMRYSTIISKGQVVWEDKQTLVLAMNISDAGSMSDCIAIPKKSILQK